MAIHNRHDFQAFSTLGRANLRAAALGHSEGCVDEAFLFIQHTSVAKFVGDIRQNLTQHLAAAPSLKPAMHRFVVRITLRQYVPLRPGVQNPQCRSAGLRPIASMGSAISSGTYAKPVKAMYSASIPIIGLHPGASRNGLPVPPRRSQRRGNDLTGGVCRPVLEPKDHDCMTGATSNWPISKGTI